MLLETHRFEFGEFLLDAKEKVLLRQGKPLPITPKVFQLLLVLVENHGHVVEKDVLMNTVWADSFVEESNLTFSIRQLRKILGDERQNPQFIKTIPKSGYSFIAQVKTGNNKSEFFDSSQSAENSKNFSFLREIDESPPRQAKPITKQFYLIWSSVILVLITSFAVFYWWFATKSPESIPRMKFERLTSNGKIRIAAVSPDGKSVAYVLDDEDQQSLWFKNIAAGSDVQILPPTEDTSLHSITFSPDGNYVYYGANETLYQLPVLGGLPKKVLQNFDSGYQPNSITFSPDGNQFAFVRRLSESESALFVANANGTGERILASSKRPDIFLRSAAWSPDSKVIAAASYGKVFIVRVADGVVSSIPSPGWSIVLQIGWHPDGNTLFVLATEGRSSISHQIWSLSYPEGEVRNITNDFNNYHSISLTADGRALVAVRVEQTAHIRVIAYARSFSNKKQ